MAYMGRILATTIFVFIKAYFYSKALLNGEAIQTTEWIVTVGLAFFVYYLGYQYDKANYFAKSLEDVFDNTQTMIWTWEAATGKVIMSEGCERIYGVTRKEFERQTDLWFLTIHPEDRPIGLYFDSRTRNGFDETVRYRIYNQSGNIKWVQMVGHPVLDHHGNVVKINGVTIDITKEKEKDQEYKKIIDASPVANVIIKNGQVEYANSNAVQMLGAGCLEEISGRNVLEFVTSENQEQAEECLREIEEGIIEHVPFKEYELMTLHHTSIIVEFSGIKTLFGEESVLLVVAKDITENKRVMKEKERAELDLKKTLKELKELKFAIDEATIVSIADAEGRITYVNDRFEESSEYTRKEILGRNHRIVNSGYHDASFYKEMWDTITSGEVWKGIVRNRSKYGNFYWLDMTIVPFLDEEQKPYQYVSIRNDITDKIKSQQDVQHLAYHDSLTSLGNRHAMNRFLKDKLETNKGEQQEMSLLFIDFDRFKNVNDTLGHSYGDLLLQHIAKRLQQSISSEESLFRYGGDEFIVVVNDGDRRIVEQKVNDLMEQFSEAIDLKEQEVYTTPSIGISRFPRDGVTSEELLRKADAAMYHAKDNGRNTYWFYETFIGEQREKEAHIEQELRKALKEKQFSLLFQPKVDLITEETIGYEALIRWNHPQLGTISPLDFIPVAEETGLIHDIGDWVIEEACRILQRINENREVQVPVAVNISAKQFERVDFVKKASAIFDRLGFNPRLVEFEITESIVQKVERSVKVIQALKSLGVTVSMDDFGTGYSSLSALQDMDIDVLKVDQSFIQKMGNGKSDSLVQAIIQMGDSLGFTVVAEGVETKEHVELLKEYGCTIGQGYYYSPPVSPYLLIEEYSLY
ncbi:EAL domain-containing protein [Pontibacillus sp. ALD_SL1]|uniref:sensor domain-containing protein n=1 Tax=Pontibacillus sp. ALD_SL1 TaxID=2777185 RepID=UPI001A9675DE|nr:EAL domain-containing protein [Pontibacillus sp. ALD_SL1]QST00875.1 EAL domain-containing protein [Pontibacillus sp. ALD_SL1]